MTLRPLILSVTVLAGSVSGCGTPAALVKPTALAATPTTTTPCPISRYNPSGRATLYDFSLFTCRGTTQADCTRIPVWERACSSSDAEAQLHQKKYCDVPHMATSILLVYGTTEIAEVAAGQYPSQYPLGDPVITVCGTPLPRE